MRQAFDSARGLAEDELGDAARPPDWSNTAPVEFQPEVAHPHRVEGLTDDPGARTLKREDSEGATGPVLKQGRLADTSLPAVVT